MGEHQDVSVSIQGLTSVNVNHSLGMQGTAPHPQRMLNTSDCPRNHTVSPSGTSPIPSQQHKADYYRNHRCGGPHAVGTQLLPAAVAPDITSWDRGVWTNPSSFGSGAEGLNPHTRTAEKRWQHLKPLQQFAKQTDVNFSLISFQPKTGLQSHYSCRVRVLLQSAYTGSCASRRSNKPSC